METVITFYNQAVDLILRKDLILLYLLSSVYFVTAIIVFFILLYGITAPYGRYARGGWGILVNGKFAWFVQEIPSFAIPVMFVLFDQNAPKFSVMPNMLFFSLYSIHYFQR